MKAELIAMLELQDQMNQVVHPNWRAQAFPWYRAIWTECAELLEHYGWKWWKKQSPDVEQVRLEIVDIWHFGMSTWLADSHDYHRIAAEIALEWQISPTCTDPREAIEALALDTLQTHQLNIALFCELMAAADMNLEQLYRRYIGKHVLNVFRQDHGYKEGSYQKNWYGKEDNLVLTDILAKLDCPPEDLGKTIYGALKESYPG